MTSICIQANNLNTTLGSHRALLDVSFHIHHGELAAIVGPNGGGKTTLLKLLERLIEPTTGTLDVRDVNGNPMPNDRIGYVPQLKTIDRSFPARSIELVVTGLRRRWPWRIREEERTKAMDALERVGAASLADRQLSVLSGGELQRVYLARSLVREPLLLLLDEPATGVDAVGETDIYRVLEEVQNRTGATIVMVTHDWGIARHHADVVLVLNRTLVSSGPPDEALREEHLRRAYGHEGHAHAMH